MLTLPSSTKIFMAREPVDVRKSFDGLSIAVRAMLEKDPMSGYLFVFFNRTRTIVKALYWERGAFCVWSKRLERGRFTPLPASRPGQCVELDWADLMMLVSGVDLRSVKRRPMWEPRRSESSAPTSV
ncbi:MAG TPA: IS66 family insertion sequence element accessory protein TnpB [Vicinamibacterales bacterium]|nr:IS66 family insertion sequence element accessory protein TnpB [Vicinamibacterales bacterium]